MSFEWNPKISDSPEGKKRPLPRKETPPSREELRQRLSEFIDRRSMALDSKTRESSYPDSLAEHAKNFEREQYSHGTLDIDFIGVDHVSETLLLFRKELETAIAAADFVIIEASIETSNTLTLDEAKQFEISEKLQDDKSRIVGIKPTGSRNYAFFFEVENMAKKHDKQVVCMDPISDERMLQSGILEKDLYREQIADSDNLTRIGSEAVGITAAVAAAGTGGLNLYKIAENTFSPVGKEESVPGKEGEYEKTTFSRRDFLKKSLAIAASATVMAAIPKIAIDNKKMIREHSSLGTAYTRYNFRDYRDVAIAEGMHQLSKSFSKKMKVVVIYGSDHRNRIREYLAASQTRSVKYAAYKPYRKTAPLQISAYRYMFNPEGNSHQPNNGWISEDSIGKWKRTLQWRDK